MTVLVAALRDMGRFSPLHAFVARNGQSWPSATWRRRRMTPRECFANAARLVLRSTTERYQYVEGFVLRPGLFPIHHAWVLRDGQALDPTLQRPEECAFHGVVLDQETLASELLRLGYFGVLDTTRGPNFALMVRMDPEFQRCLDQMRQALTETLHGQACTTA